MIEECMKRCGYEAGETTYYVGDMPDDIEAALRAGVVPLGFVNDSVDVSSDEIKAHRDLINEKGAMTILGNFDELIRYLKDNYT